MAFALIQCYFSMLRETHCFFADECARLESHGGTETQNLGAGHQESLLTHSDQPWLIAMRDILRGFSTYHFHDTTPTARVRQFGYELDNKTLLFDGGNLAAFLVMIQREHPIHYRRIVETVRLVAPYFDDFVLTRTHRMQVYLDWHHMKSDMTFGAHQLSDGTLRAICLITLLLQPPEKLPLVLIVDEPELGLHPYALNLIASLFRAASEHVQVIISTQSSTFLDHFDPEDVIVAEHHDGKSTFHRPGAEKLEAWLEEYSLGEVWEKNVIGGGPH